MLRNVLCCLRLEFAAAVIDFRKPRLVGAEYSKGTPAEYIVQSVIQSIVIAAVKEHDFSAQSAVLCRDLSAWRSLAVFEVSLILVEIISPLS